MSMDEEIKKLLNNEYKKPYLIEMIMLLNKTKKLEHFRYIDQFISEHTERLKVIKSIG